MNSKPAYQQLFLLLFLLLAAPLQALQNELTGHPSPYLAQHGKDPVHWQEWSAEIMELAKKEDKLLFISSGYFACHWCHVMQRESFNNEQIAAVLNNYFIPIKIDRELEPALDAHLIDFVQRTQGQAGWPLNVFITPEGYPLIGTTYAPSENFLLVLRRLQQSWVDERDALRDLARRGLLALIQARKPENQPDQVYSVSDLRMALLKSALQLGDELLGGFGQANRFPMSPQLDALLEVQSRIQDARLSEFLVLTLDQMANNGMRDHLGGGFFRYTVDPDWQIPHYEKMLYTQALLARLYMTAANVLDQKKYLAVAEDTLKFVIKNMRGIQGGYVASFSAVDDKDVEGGYYLWSSAELNELLTPELLVLASKYWQLDGVKDGTEHAVLPRGGISMEQVAEKAGLDRNQVEKDLELARSQLLAARSKRGLPIDDKELAGWNGLLLSALSIGASTFNNNEFFLAAKALRNFLVNQLWDGTRLVRARKGGRPIGEASLEDYAYVAEGLAKWALVSKNETDAELSRSLIKLAWKRYYSEDGWRSSDQAVLPGMPMDKAQEDGALPSPAALIIALSLNSGDAALVERAEGVAKDVLARIQDNPFWYASHVSALNGVRVD